MDYKTFWKIIEDAKAQSEGDIDAQLDLIHATLVQLPAQEIVEYDRIFTEYYFESYRWDLWAAAYLINGGCSDDWFDYFRAGLITQGEKVFTDALKDPNTLADVVVMEDGEPSLESDWAAGVEEMSYVAQKAYEEKTGEEMPFSPTPRTDIKGQKWNEDEVASVLPRLAAHCGYD